MKIKLSELKKIIEQESRLALIAEVEDDAMREGDVVNLFSGDDAKQNVVVKIAKALARRAEELIDNKVNSVESSLDLDGIGDDIEVEVGVNVDPTLYERFLEPYPDIDGHGDLVPALAEQIYGHTTHEDVVDTSEDPLDYIIGRIETDAYDEDIEYALEALGDDRFAPPFLDQLRSDIDNTPGFDEKLKSIYGDNFTQDEIDQAARAAGHSVDRSQQSKTEKMAAKQDPQQVQSMEDEVEDQVDQYLQNLRMGAIPLDPDGDEMDDDTIVTEQMLGHWARIAGLPKLQNSDILTEQSSTDEQSREDERAAAAGVREVRKQWRRRTRDARRRDVTDQRKIAVINQATDDIMTYISRLRNAPEITRGLEGLSDSERRTRVSTRISLVEDELQTLRMAMLPEFERLRIASDRRGEVPEDAPVQSAQQVLQRQVDSDGRQRVTRTTATQQPEPPPPPPPPSPTQTPSTEDEVFAVTDTEGRAISYRALMDNILNGRKFLSIGAGGTRKRDSDDREDQKEFAQVKVIQSLLKDAGYATFNPTGYFGNQTDAAVRRMQQALDLDVDGDVGRQTAAAFDPRIAGSDVPVTGAEVDQAVANAAAGIGRLAEGVLERIIREELAKILR